MRRVRSLLSFVVFVPLQILFLPLAIAGFVLVAYKQIGVSKRLGASSTGIEILQGRRTMHVFGMRPDEPTDRLTAALPNASSRGLWLVLLPLWVKWKVSGRYFLYPRAVAPGDETVADLVPARTPHVDTILERHASEA